MPKKKPRQLDMFASSFEEAVLPLFEEHRGDWLAHARATARHLAADRDITIDDVRQLCPPPENIDPRVMGAVFAGNDWRCLRYVSSHRGVCHKRPIGLFRLVDREP
jgi:hypothetical protein